MATLTIKSIPDDLLEELRKRAEQRRRSLNREVLYVLERSVGSVRLDPEATIERISRLQRRTPLPPLTDDILDNAIQEGRP